MNKIFKTTYDAKKRALTQDFVTNKKVKLSLSFSKGIFASYFFFMIAFLPYGIILNYMYKHASIHLAFMATAGPGQGLNWWLYDTYTLTTLL